MMRSIRIFFFPPRGRDGIFGMLPSRERNGAMQAIGIENTEIRPCRKDDMPSVTMIYAHHVRHGTASFETEPPSLEEMRRRHADILARGLPYLVAVAGGDILGYAYAGLYRPRAAYRDTVEDSIYIRFDLAGRGIGERLLRALLIECEGRDLRQMIAAVGDSANTASVRVHERCGFERIGVFRSIGYKHGRWLDSVLLQRSLGAGDTTLPSHRA